MCRGCCCSSLCKRAFFPPLGHQHLKLHHPALQCADHVPCSAPRAQPSPRFRCQRRSRPHAALRLRIRGCRVRLLVSAAARRPASVAVDSPVVVASGSCVQLSLSVVVVGCEAAGKCSAVHCDEKTRHQRSPNRIWLVIRCSGPRVLQLQSAILGQRDADVTCAAAYSSDVAV
jgi:hypothetical protein